VKAINPGATETPVDGVDSDCDQKELCYVDLDEDLFGSNVTVGSNSWLCNSSGVAKNPNDCDDALKLLNPGAEDLVADGVDSDCDGKESCYRDGDEDGYGHETDLDVVEGLELGATGVCESSGHPDNQDDCDDSDADVHPTAIDEAGDKLDSDCDGWDLCFQDEDGDGYAPEENPQIEYVTVGIDCIEAGYAPIATDCDDTNADRAPGLTESIANGVDEDCDDNEACFADGDGDGFGGGVLNAPDLACASAMDGVALTTIDGDCSDDVAQDEYAADRFPGNLEIAWDGIDQDCSDDDLEVWLGGSGCSTSGGLPASGAIVGLLALMRRRPHSGSRAS
jgi:hypothetical protein